MTPSAFLIGRHSCWASPRPGARAPSVALVINTDDDSFALSITSAEARAMAAALEAAATWAENVLETGLGESAVDAPTKPRFDKTYCSQCGGTFGPGNSGFSHCKDHQPR